MDPVLVGTITITLECAPDGELMTDVESGDLPLVTVLGLLAMAADTVLRGTHVEDDE